MRPRSTEGSARGVGVGVAGVRHGIDEHAVGDEEVAASSGGISGEIFIFRCGDADLRGVAVGGIDDEAGLERAAGEIGAGEQPGADERVGFFRRVVAAGQNENCEEQRREMSH